VPGFVRRAMRRHGLYRSAIVELELTGRPEAAARRPVRASVAGLNTHDLPTFAGYWAGRDVEARAAQGWLSPDQVEEERALRRRQREALAHDLRTQGWLWGDDPEPGDEELLRATLRWLAASPAEALVVNLEDLWLEPAQQNVPGTTTGNWHRPARLPLERLREDPGVVDTLKDVNRIRRGAEAAR
jgi:4-alpha-glucanotransferase